MAYVIPRSLELPPFVVLSLVEGFHHVFMCRVGVRLVVAIASVGARARVSSPCVRSLGAAAPAFVVADSVVRARRRRHRRRRWRRYRTRVHSVLRQLCFEAATPCEHDAFVAVSVAVAGARWRAHRSGVQRYKTRGSSGSVSVLRVADCSTCLSLARAGARDALVRDGSSDARAAACRSECFEIARIWSTALLLGRGDRSALTAAS